MGLGEAEAIVLAIELGMMVALSTLQTFWPNFGGKSGSTSGANQPDSRFDMLKGKFSSTRVVPSSGNVFADLGLRDAEEKQTKVRLAVAINQSIEATGLSQAAAAQRLHVNQPETSALANYRLSGFSVERLIHFLNALAEM